MAAPAVARSSTRSSYVAALVLAAALPVTALMLYAAFGNPGAMRLVAPANERAPMSHDQVVAMVESLATRMKEHPEDPTGWRLLARAYSAMGRYPRVGCCFHRGRCAGYGGCIAPCRLGRCARDAESVARRRAVHARSPRARTRPRSPEGVVARRIGGARAQGFRRRNRRMAEVAGAVSDGQRRGEGNRRDDRRSGCGEARGAGGAAGVGKGSAVRECKHFPAECAGAKCRSGRCIGDHGTRLARSETARAGGGSRHAVHLCTCRGRAADAACGRAHVRGRAAARLQTRRFDGDDAGGAAFDGEGGNCRGADLENRQRNALAGRPAGQQRSSAGPARAVYRSSSTTSCAEAGKFACLASATRPQANLLPPGRDSESAGGLHAERLAARRGYVTLFSDVAFSVHGGEVLVVTGPNGSGKTTLLRMLAGLTAPAAGEIRWQQHVMRPFDERLRGAVAFNGHLPALKDELTAEENLVQWIALDDRLPPRTSLPKRSTKSRSVVNAACRSACSRKDNADASGSRVCGSSQRRYGFSTSRLPRSMRMASTCCAHCSLRTSTAAAFALRHRTRGCRYREDANARSRSGRAHPHDDRRRVSRPATSRCGQRCPILGAARPSGGRWPATVASRCGPKRNSVSSLLFYVIVVSLFPLAASPSARIARRDRPRRAVGRRAARIAAVAAAALRRGLRRRNARADGDVATAARRDSCPVKSWRIG